MQTAAFAGGRLFWPGIFGFSWHQGEFSKSHLPFQAVARHKEFRVVTEMNFGYKIENSGEKTQKIKRQCSFIFRLFARCSFSYFFVWLKS